VVEDQRGGRNDHSPRQQYEGQQMRLFVARADSIVGEGEGSELRGRRGGMRQALNRPPWVIVFKTVQD
jgi:hypothetical protein